MADTAAKGSSQASTTYVLCDGGVVANNPSAEAVAFTSIAYGQNNELVSPKVQLHPFLLLYSELLACMLRNMQAQLMLPRQLCDNNVDHHTVCLLQLVTINCCSGWS